MSAIERGIAIGVLGLMLAYSSNAIAASDTIFQGVLGPYGDRCGGDFLVKKKTIEWTSPQGICTPTAYKVIEQRKNGEDQFVVYQLKSVSKGCTYSVVSLEYDHQHPVLWDVKLYKTIKDFKRDNEDLQCPLTRFDK
jgi:hypothetical protein